MTHSFDITVLKFGSSVLSEKSDLAYAVEEIYRERRRGRKVIAVVSAIGDATDELIAEAEELSSVAAPECLALLLGTGEIRSASFLGIKCLEAGTAAKPLLPHEFGLTAVGDTLDAQCVGADRERLLEEFEENDVLIVPGFIANDENLRPRLLGRGGSDLTAVLIADTLDAADCRLLKDTDGVYESDPALPGPSPRLFEDLSFADASKIDGAVLQKKAIRFAEERGRSFEVSRAGSWHGTRVGTPSSSLIPSDRLRRRLSVVLLGCGHVGAAVYRRLKNDSRFAVEEIAVRDLTKERPGIAPSLLTDDPLSAAASGADVVIELTGNLNRGFDWVANALRCGSHVITANKELIAERGIELRDIARRSNRKLVYSPAVGGSLPVLENLAATESQDIKSVVGILNGTSNFLLDELSAGQNLDEALASARENGLCEHDATSDLTGRDAARKIQIIARSLGWGDVDVELGAAINETTQDQCAKARSSGHSLRQVARLVATENGAVASVGLELCPSDSPLGRTGGPENRVELNNQTETFLSLKGLGAGPEPTCESVIGDLLEIRRFACQEFWGEDLEAVQ